MKASDLWRVTTLNNMGRSPETDNLLTEAEARDTVVRLNAERLDGRADWVAQRLDEAIRDYADEMASEAMAEG